MQLNLVLARGGLGVARSARSGTTSRPSWPSTRERAAHRDLPRRHARSATARSWWTRTPREAVVIDPGDEPERVLRALESAGARAVALLHTHAHFDHIGATRAVSEATGAPIRLHPADRPLYDALPDQAALFGLTRRCAEGRRRAALRRRARRASAASPLRAIHTPGHTPGSTCFELDRRRAPPLLRRHALPPLDRPDGPLGRRHRSDPRVDSGQALRPARRHAGRSAATGPTRRSRRSGGSIPSRRFEVGRCYNLRAMRLSLPQKSSLVAASGRTRRRSARGTTSRCDPSSWTASTSPRS